MVNTLLVLLVFFFIAFIIYWNVVVLPGSNSNTSTNTSTSTLTNTNTTITEWQGLFGYISQDLPIDFKSISLNDPILQGIYPLPLQIPMYIFNSNAQSLPMMTSGWFASQPGSKVVLQYIMDSQTNLVPLPNDIQITPGLTSTSSLIDAITTFMQTPNDTALLSGFEFTPTLDQIGETVNWQMNLYDASNPVAVLKQATFEAHILPLPSISIVPDAQQISPIDFGTTLRNPVTGIPEYYSQAQGFTLYNQTSDLTLDLTQFTLRENGDSYSFKLDTSLPSTLAPGENVHFNIVSYLQSESLAGTLLDTLVMNVQLPNTQVYSFSFDTQTAFLLPVLFQGSMSSPQVYLGTSRSVLFNVTNLNSSFDLDGYQLHLTDTEFYFTETGNQDLTISSFPSSTVVQVSIEYKPTLVTFKPTPLQEQYSFTLGWHDRNTSTFFPGWMSLPSLAFDQEMAFSVPYQTPTVIEIPLINVSTSQLNNIQITWSVNPSVNGNEATVTIQPGDAGACHATTSVSTQGSGVFGTVTFTAENGVQLGQVSWTVNFV